MDIIADPAAFSSRCRSWRQGGQRVALVPTMGYLHAGHESLLRHARQMADRLALSIFVNPAQFGPNEDLDRYPRDPEGDAAKARAAGVDVIFMPTPQTMYLPGHETWVDVPGLGKGLCGRERPGHFRGVATVVAKLFLLALPDWALFGQKDWQQLAIIRRMVRDLNIPVQVVGLPTVREADGLALSSRNVYLSPQERAQASGLYHGLRLLRSWADQETGTDTLIRRLTDWYAANLALAGLEYLEIVDPDDLFPLQHISGPALAAVAARFGKARLIDNILIGPEQARAGV